MLENQETFEVVEGLETGRYKGKINDISIRDIITDEEKFYYMSFEIEESENGVTSSNWLDVPYPMGKGEIGKVSKRLGRLMTKAGFNFEDNKKVNSELINSLFFKREIDFNLRMDKKDFLKIISINDINFN